MVKTDKKPIKIGVVIVAYNSSDDIRKCIESVQAQTTENIKALPIVIDNNSADDSLLIAKRCGALTIENQKNLGFAKAVNIGIEKAFAESCEFILVFNPDAVLIDGSLGYMLNEFLNDESVAAVGPKMSEDGANDHYYLKSPGVFTVLFYYTFLRKWTLNKKSLLGFYSHTNLRDKSQYVEQIPGACLLTSRAVLEEVGTLDEDFAIWFEDVEWSYRANKHGYSLLYCPEAIVKHKGGVSFDKWQGIEKTTTFLISLKTFFRKHKPLRMPLVVAILCTNYLLVYIKSGNKDYLHLINRLLFQKKGNLPN